MRNIILILLVAILISSCGGPKDGNRRIDGMQRMVDQGILTGSE